MMSKKLPLWRVPSKPLMMTSNLWERGQVSVLMVEMKKANKEVECKSKWVNICIYRGLRDLLTGRWSSLEEKAK